MMDHSQAQEQMIAERYLLNELTPEARDAFEEHVFDCPECALDLRAAAAFIDEAKAQLPALAPASSATPMQPKAKRNWWFSGWRPVFVVPSFAALLLAIGYQNLVQFPALRNQAAQPRILAMTTLHGATRGAPVATIVADPAQGIGLPIDLSPEPGAAPVASYSLALMDATGKQVWTGTYAATGSNNGGPRILVAIPGAILRNGSYTMTVTGVDAQGTRTPLDRYTFNVEMSH